MATSEMLRRIFITHHTHADIGYTDQPLEVLDQQLSYLDQAVALARKNPRFRWTVEAAYLVKDYLRNRPPADSEALLGLLRSGQFEMGAFEMQPLTELMTSEELCESVKYAVYLGTREGFRVETAQLDDVCGFAAGLPSALAPQGVRYLLCGAGAFQAYLPWADLPHLFWLEDFNRNRLLVYNLGIDRTSSPQLATCLDAVYGMAAKYLLNPCRKTSDEGGPETAFRQLAARLEREGYPYEELLLQYGGDNRGPAGDLMDLVDRLNASGRLPHLELVTPSVFFHLMEEKYAAGIPIRRGVVTDPWITRVNPTPHPLKQFLLAQRRRRYLEQCGGHADETLRENLALYADHTCGLSEWHAPELHTDAASNDAVFENLRASWRHKAQYAEEAAAHSAVLLRQALNRASQPGLAVRNLADHPQAGVAELRLGRDMAPLASLALADGTPVRWQETEYHHHYFVELPALASRSTLPLLAEYGEAVDYLERPVATAPPLPRALDTDYFRLALDADGFITRLASLDGRTLYSDEALFSLDLQLPQDYHLGWDAAGMRSLEHSAFPKPSFSPPKMLCAGVVAWRWEQRGFYHEGLDFRLVTTCYRHLPFIDVECFVAKPAHRTLESLYLSCHLHGRARRWLLGQHTHDLDPQRDLLPGAMRDLFYAPCGAALDAGDFTAVMQSLDAPVLHPGRTQLFAWNPNRTYDREPAAFHWNIYQNMLVTDCPAWQPILDTFRFRLFPGHALDGWPSPADSIAFILR